MAKPRPGKKRGKDGGAQTQLPGTRESLSSSTTRILPMQLQIGDRLSDETGEWGSRQPSAHDGRRQDRARTRATRGSAGGHRGADMGRSRANRGEERVVTPGTA
jgi:hypothetical protein